MVTDDCHSAMGDKNNSVCMTANAVVNHSVFQFSKILFHILRKVQSRFIIIEKLQEPSSFALLSLTRDLL